MSATRRPAERERVYVPDRASWRRWLAKHHKTSPGVWLVFDKTASNANRLTWSDAVDEALCFGWIDSKTNKLDERQYLQMFSPRNAKSGWSAINKAKVERLIASKKMRPAGMRMIELAKERGTWTALDAYDAAVEPADFQKALAGNKAARKYWEAFPLSARKGILHWIATAKRPETRAKRIEETVRLAAENVRAGQWKPK